ncbi:MAG: hypothetical protein ACFCUG_11775 [Thiotrichales bacterium]
MLQPFVGRTVADVYQLSAAAMHLPRYPQYRVDETVSARYRYYYNRSARYCSCQSARFVLFGGTVSTLVEDGVYDPTHDLSSWWNGYYREQFGAQVGEVIKYSGAQGYRAYLSANPEPRVITPHPYDDTHIPRERFYLSAPDVVARLNDKGEMRALSRRAVPYQVYDAASFAADHWRDEWELPFVVKLTTPSGGGDGVCICRDLNDVAAAKLRFAGQTVKLERYLDNIRRNINVNLCVTPTGAVSLIGGSLQRVESDARYAGNLIDLAWQPEDAVREICVEIADNAAQMGWHGVCGLDLIETDDGDYHFIDPNFRLNGSTPFYLMRDYFATHFATPLLSTGYYTYAGDPVTFLDEFRSEIEAKRLAPIGIYYDPCEDDLTRVYAAVTSDGDLDEYAAFEATLSAKRLRAGIYL